MTLLLHSAEFVLSQPGDTNDPIQMELGDTQQELRVRLEWESSGIYMVMNTDHWAVHHPHELVDVLVRIHEAALPLFDYFDRLEE